MSPKDAGDKFFHHTGLQVSFWLPLTFFPARLVFLRVVFFFFPHKGKLQVAYDPVSANVSSTLPLVSILLTGVLLCGTLHATFKPALKIPPLLSFFLTCSHQLFKVHSLLSLSFFFFFKPDYL